MEKEPRERPVKKKCVIVAGGTLEDEDFHRRIIQEAEIIICADGGARHVWRLGIIPDLVIGDLDTLRENEAKDLVDRHVELIRYPQAKDYTDTHLCLLKALELGYQHIEMVGCLGGRFDHALANVMLLALPQAREVDVRICDPLQEIFLIKPGMTLTGQKGEIISLLPLSEAVTGISTAGLAYQVPHGKFEMGIGNGISNVFSEEKVEITLGKGLLLGIRLKKEKSG